jgi:dipeptidyl aminopeptidase/acylaminoacyl peptidase
MNFQKYILFVLFTLIPGVVLANSIESSDSSKSGLKNVTVNEYGPWESLVSRDSAALSNDGQFLIYGINRNNENNELRLHNLKSSKIEIIDQAINPVFSMDSKWLGYVITVSPEQARKLKRDKKPNHNKFGLMNLQTGKREVFNNILSFSFSGDGFSVALKRYKEKEQKHEGTDLIVRNLSTLEDINFGNISEYKWQHEGALLALIISARDKAGNGIQLFNPKMGNIQVLDSMNSLYSGLQWRKKSSDLAVYRAEENELFESDTNNILVWKELAAKEAEKKVFNHDTIENLDELTNVNGHYKLTWKKDGKALYLSTKKRIKKDIKESPENEDSTSALETEIEPAEKKDEYVEAPDLQIWHSKDVMIIPEQIQNEEKHIKQSYVAIWHLNTNAFVVLANEKLKQLNIQTDINFVLGYDHSPYELEGMFGREKFDLYKVDLETGEQTKFLEQISRIYQVSPNGRYLAYLSQNNYFIYDFMKHNKFNLTKENKAEFINFDDDHPVPQKPSYGFVGWSKNSKSIIVNSKYDLWQLWVNGKKGRAITGGEKQKVRHRYIKFDDDETSINTRKSMIVSLYGDLTKKFGYGSVKIADKVSNQLFLDASVSSIIKAKHKEKYAFVIQDFHDSPDYFMSGKNFAKNKQISKTNPFQSKFNWGHSQLINYTNKNGVELQGALFYPVNYQKGKKYPMITYIYEKLSQRVHNYSVPTEMNYYNPSTWSQEGYFVLLPDIVFDTRNPGVSSAKTLEIAVKKVVDMGLVDPNRIGLIGHSWGGYQTAFAVTNTNVFAAAVAGAGLTDLTSMYGMVAWDFGGTPENFHFEVGQERMETPPWRDADSYIKNSPVMNVMNLNTPLLFEVGDHDKNVDWRQGIELYNAARRENKEMVLLVYAKEGHGLKKKENRIDYHHRISQWFGHYLKGQNARDWVKNGIPYLEQKRNLKTWNDEKQKEREKSN